MNWMGLNFMLYVCAKTVEQYAVYTARNIISFVVSEGGGECRKTLKRKKNDLIFFSLRLGTKPTYININAYVNGARENTRHGPCGARENLNSLALCMTETIQSFKSRYDSPAHASSRPLHKYIYTHKRAYYNILRGSWTECVRETASRMAGTATKCLESIRR